MAVFDPEVFSFMFDITDVPPVVRKVVIPEDVRVNAVGQFVPITVYIVNNSSTPGRVFLMNPTDGPTVTIYGPSDIVVLPATAMEEVEQGIFTYTFDTTGLSTGRYSGIFAASNGTQDMVSKKYFLFNIK